MIPIRRRQAVPKDEVLAIFTAAPVIDVDELRSDLDAALAQDPRDPYEGTDRRRSSASSGGPGRTGPDPG